MTQRPLASHIAVVAIIAALSAGRVGAFDACPTVVAVDPFATQPNLVDLQQSDVSSSPKPEGPAGDRPLPHVWLIDHSGSMYADYQVSQKRDGKPYYIEQREFRDFVVDDVGANFRDGTDSAAVVAFNEYAYAWNGSVATKIDGTGPSFSTIKVTTKSALSSHLSALPPPPYGKPVAGLPAPVAGASDCGQPGAATNCSKMLAGLDAARALLDTEGGEGIIWLITDNIYEPGTGATGLAAAELDQNRRFYEALRDTTAFRVVVAYPIVRATRGAWLRSTSLFVYGIYYDKDERRRTPVAEVRRLLGDGVPGLLLSDGQTKKMADYATEASPSRGRPFRLKPLDQDVVRISATADVKQLGGKKEMGQKVKLQVKLRVQNILDHRHISSVTFRVNNGKWTAYEPQQRSAVSMKSMNTVCPATFGGQDVTVKDIKPGEAKELDVELEMPPVDYTITSLNDLFEVAFNDHVIMGGLLQAELLNVESETSIRPENFMGTYGASSLPDVFRNPKSVNYTGQFLGRTAKIENPGTVVMLLLLAAAVVAGLLALLGVFMLTSVSRRFILDGTDRGAISIPRLRSTPLQRGAETIGRATLSFGGTVNVRGVGGHVARREGQGWSLAKGGGPGIKVELRRTKR